MLNQTNNKQQNFIAELITNLTIALANQIGGKTRRLVRSLSLNAFFLRWYLILAIPSSIAEPSEAERY